jgi:flagellar biosynthetic protein FliO
MMSVELMAAAAKLLGVLALMIGGLLVFNRYSRRCLNGRSAGGHKALQVLESTPVGLKKSVTLIRVPGAVLVLGVANDRITLLDRIEGRDYDAALETRPIQPVPTFQEHLRKLTGGWQRKPLDPGSAASAEARPC